jgi:hypothetical protein
MGNRRWLAFGVVTAGVGFLVWYLFFRPKKGAPPPPVFDFDIKVNPSSGTVSQSGNISTTVTVTLISGSPQTVTLSASGLPSGATATFTPQSGLPTFQSTLTIATSSTTPAGTYNVTIAGTGGGLTKTATYMLTVTAPTPPPGCTPPTGNLVKNPSFEEGTSGWDYFNAAVTDVDKYCGKYCCFLNNITEANIMQIYPLSSGTYRMQLRYKPLDATKPCFVVRPLIDEITLKKTSTGEWTINLAHPERDAAKVISDTALTNGWRELLVEFYVSPETVAEVAQAVGQGSGWFDILLLPIEHTPEEEQCTGLQYIDDVWLWKVS